MLTTILTISLLVNAVLIFALFVREPRKEIVFMDPPKKRPANLILIGSRKAKP